MEIKRVDETVKGILGMIMLSVAILDFQFSKVCDAWKDWEKCIFFLSL